LFGENRNKNLACMEPESFVTEGVGVCPTWYHVPTIDEWKWLFNEWVSEWLWSNEQKFYNITNFMNALQIPASGNSDSGIWNNYSWKFLEKREDILINSYFIYENGFNGQRWIYASSTKNENGKYYNMSFGKNFGYGPNFNIDFTSTNEDDSSISVRCFKD
jgi:uncharacterized protein (TIGR02145 family)